MQSQSRMNAVAVMAALGVGCLPDTQSIKRSRYSTAFYTNREVGRNESCPCGSGKKYKKCCNRVDPRAQLASLADGMDDKAGEPSVIDIPEPVMKELCRVD